VQYGSYPAFERLPEVKEELLATELELALESPQGGYAGTLGEVSARSPGPTREIVGGFLRYQNSVASLAQSEQQKIRNIAGLIVKSYQPRCHPIRTVRLVGHADFDPVRERREPGFIRRISRERALAVKQALERLINNPLLSSRLAWDVRGAGSAQLVVPNPRTEQERMRNRRVEIFLPAATSPKPKCACILAGDPRFNAWLQSSLNKLLGLRLAVTGAFDLPTRSALRSFQAKRGLPLTTGVNPVTQLSLLQAGADDAPCAVEPCETSCALFLPAITSKNYEDYVAAQTTGRVTILINGRNSGGLGLDIDNSEAFEQMQKAVEALKSRDSVYLAAWQFDPGIALTTTSSVGVQTWGELFREKAKQGVKIRILMTEYDPLTPFYNQVHNQYLPALDKRIAELPGASSDNLKYVVSPHPATWARKMAGSHHQKFMVIRKAGITTAFCGGLDIAFLRTPAYWSYRGLFAWHDIHSRLEGLIARDLEQEFVLRWNREKGTSTVPPRKGWKPVEQLVQPPVQPADRAKDRNLSKVQMLRTVSIQGRGLNVQNTRRDDIWQAYLRLINCANDFLYMENQYFREPRLADAIVQRSKAQPNLIVIIVVPEKTDDAPNIIVQHGQYLQHEFFSRLYAGMNANRLRVYSMSGRFIHSKFILIDDRALSLGSANANPRGFQLDTELNVLLDDSETTRKFRHRLWSHNLGELESTIAGWAVSGFITKWDAVANSNQKLLKKPQDMAGEGVIPFDYKTAPGRQHPLLVPDVLTELAISTTSRWSIAG
jgi:phosphatidylserine/phosphatidylglycerophosphate/cardiolipin synthase-like enzyme/outer membrane protein OmpA-like peptidoglycan-associated protein